jgi:hypothetical protein
MTIIAMRLRNPAMATGFQETSLIINPPELHKIALKSKKRMALDLFSIVYFQKKGKSLNLSLSLSPFSSGYMNRNRL